MIEFLFKNYVAINFSVEALAALTGLFCLHKYKKSVQKYFIYFLVYLFLGEFIALYSRFVAGDGLFNFLQGTKLEKNFWWSTLYWKIGAIMFFAFYFNRILTQKIFKNIVKFMALLFVVFSIIYIGVNWNRFFVQFFPIISICGALMIFLCTAFYFYELLLGEEVLNFYQSLSFFISAAIFIWWLIITPLIFYDGYLAHNLVDQNYRRVRGILYIAANIFMYLTFTFALLWCRPQKD